MDKGTNVKSVAEMPSIISENKFIPIPNFKVSTSCFYLFTINFKSLARGEVCCEKVQDIFGHAETSEKISFKTGRQFE